MTTADAFTVREDTLDVGGGIKIFYRDYMPQDLGGKVPVMGLAGFWRNGSDFRRMARKLAPERRILTPDMRGRGNSSRSKRVEDYRFETLVADTWQLLDHLGIERVVVTGIALGGFIAIQMATERPERIAGIVLNDVGTETSSPGAHAMVKNLDFEEYSLEEAIARTKKQHAQYLTEFSEEDWAEFALQGYAETKPGRYARGFDELTQKETHRFKQAKPSFIEEFRALRIPVAILRGEHSEYMPQDLAEGLVGENPRAALTTVDGRGHWPMLDEPQSLATIRRVAEQADARS